MKNVKTILLAASVLFFAAGAAQAVEMDDLGVTIKMIDSDDMKGVSTELHLPDAASDVAREHAEGRDGKGLSRANEVHNRNDVRKDEHDGEHDGKDHSADKKDEKDDHMSSRDESRDSHDEARDSHDDMKDGQNEMHDESKEVNEDVKGDMVDRMGDTTTPAVSN